MTAAAQLPSTSTAPAPVSSRKRSAPKELVQPRRHSKPNLERRTSLASPHLRCPSAPAVQPQAAIQNASNPASPALPNVVASQASQSSSATENNILPSPAPSEDVTSDRGRGATIVSLGDDDEDEGDNDTETRVAEGSIPAARRSMSRPDPSPMPAPVEHQANSAIDASRAPDPPHSTEPRLVNTQQTGHDRPVQPLPPATSHGPDPSLLTGGMSPPDMNSPRWRTLPPPGLSCFAPDFCLPELQHLINISGGRQNFTGVQNVRVELMSEAVRTGDRDYMGFHQLMCLRSLSPAHLPPEISTLAATLPALDILSHLIQNTQVSNGFLTWFADFPVSLEHMKRLWPDEYDAQILRFRQFIALAVNGWTKLQNSCFEKKLPPTAVEIRRELGMCSLLFQAIINRAVLRRLCNFREPISETQSNFFTEADSAFKDHQTSLEKVWTSSQTTQQLTAEELRSEQLYRARIYAAEEYFLAPATPQQEPPTLQARRMSRQAQMAQGQQLNPSMRQTYSPVQYASPTMSPAYQDQALPSTHHHAMPAQQMNRPQVQIDIPPTRTSSAQMGLMTPGSALPSSHLAAMSRQGFTHDQQQLQPLVQVGSPMMRPPSGFNVTQSGHSPVSQNWSRMQAQPSLSAAYHPLENQQFNGSVMRQEIPNGAHQQPVYQRRPSGPVPAFNNIHQLQAHHQRQVQAQHVLLSNSAPPPAAAQVNRQMAHQADPRQVNGHAQSPIHQQNQQSAPFIPPYGHLWQPQPIDPSQSALHQAHLRSPLLKTAPNPKVGRKLYQSVVGFAVPPTKLANKRAQQTLEFAASEEDINNLPSQMLASLGNPTIRVVSEETKMYRLRCARSQTTEEHEWILQDTYWPAGMFLVFNGALLDMRKRMMHGKDLPVDVTPFVRQGENQLEINLLRGPNEEMISNFVVAIEVVGIQHHDSIKADCSSKKVLPAAEVLESIKSSLNGPEEDDDIAIVDSNVTINLFDPFTNCSVCNIPARGRYCLHRNCFDLEIFLQTRNRKQADSPSAVDVWKCPICRADARPKNLVVDGFLIEVHKKLSEMDQLNTRAIIVDSDGKWRPKPEEKKDDSRGSHSATPVAPKRTSTATPVSHLPSRSPRVIELE